MGAKKTNKLGKEYGPIRVTGNIKRNVYKDMQASMELLGIDTESVYISLSITKFNQSILNKKTSE
jgi:hypothetical protein